MLCDIIIVMPRKCWSMNDVRLIAKWFIRSVAYQYIFTCLNACVCNNCLGPEDLNIQAIW